jgi:hypothetical protein
MVLCFLLQEGGEVKGNNNNDSNNDKNKWSFNLKKTERCVFGFGGGGGGGKRWWWWWWWCWCNKFELLEG